MVTLVSVALVLVAVLAASFPVERLLKRSRKEMQNPGWYVVFFSLFLPACYLVYAMVPIESQLLYAAYAGAGGVAALVAQSLFGAKLHRDKHNEA